MKNIFKVLVYLHHQQLWIVVDRRVDRIIVFRIEIKVV